MNGRMSKKLHKEAMKLARANWMEYVSAICQWPLSARLRFSRDILLHAKRYRPKGESNVRNI